MFRTTLTAFVFSLGFTLAASAATLTETVVADLQAQGYERIELRETNGVLKVEAIKGTEKLELTFDAATGALLKREVQAVEAGEDVTPGVYVAGGHDDDQGDDLEDDDHGGSSGDDSHDDSEDDSNDDSHDDSNDDGPDHDSGDDSHDGADHD